MLFQAFQTSLVVSPNYTIASQFFYHRMNTPSQWTLQMNHASRLRDDSSFALLIGKKSSANEKTHQATNGTSSFTLKQSKPN